jgi:hypothetical protein
MILDHIANKSVIVELHSSEHQESRREKSILVVAVIAIEEEVAKGVLSKSVSRNRGSRCCNRGATGI